MTHSQPVNTSAMNLSSSALAGKTLDANKDTLAFFMIANALGETVESSSYVRAVMGVGVALKEISGDERMERLSVRLLTGKFRVVVAAVLEGSERRGTCVTVERRSK